VIKAKSRQLPQKVSVVHFTPTVRRGGAERQLMTIVRNSTAIEHHVISLYMPSQNYLEESESIRVIQSHSFIGRVIEFSRIMKEVTPDIVVSWDTLTSLISLICSISKAYCFVNGSIRHGIYQNNIHGLLRKYLAHVSKIVIANSKAGLRANQLSQGYVLYNGVDKKFDKENTHRDEVDIQDCVRVKPFYMVSIANMVPYKDYPTIFRAMDRLRCQGIITHLIAIGDGKLRSQYEQYARDLKILDLVSFIGNIPNPESYLAKCDIFVHSSKGEGCPNAVLEAMYAGLPVIASNTGGTSEVIEDNGILYNYGNDEELSTAIKLLYQESETRKNMAERSYQIVLKKYSAEVMIINYEHLIHSIFAGESTARDLMVRI